MEFGALLAREGTVIAPPPPGVIPNYEHPESNGGMYMAGTLITLAFAFICVGLRITTKLSMAGRKLGWDDALVVLALAFSIARTTCFIVDIKHYGIAHHVWDLHVPLPRNLWLLHRIGDIMWPPGMLCVKISILMYYLLIFGTHRKFRWTCYAVMALNVSYLSATTLVHIFWCSPVASAYGIKTPGHKATCIDGYITDLTIGALNLFTDIIILLLPMPMLYHLQLTRSRKYGLVAIFAVGALTVASTMAREIEIGLKLKDGDEDQTWDVMYEVMWISIELNVAIICSCLLVCPQLFRYVLNNTQFGQSLRGLFSAQRSQSSPSKDSYSKLSFGRSPAKSNRAESERSLELKPSIREEYRSAVTIASEEQVPQGVIKQTRTFTAV